MAAVVVADGTGVVTLRFNVLMQLDQVLILPCNSEFGPANTVTFPAAPAPSVTLTGTVDTPPAADVDTVDITEWLPHLRGASGEWAGWGWFRAEHV